jgi:glycosyltransferase involved in cell wall biosynthesis
VRIVVSNPSSNPEMAHAASAFARRGWLERYHVPLAVAPGWFRSAPRALARELRRRPLPEGVDARLVDRTASVTDFARVVAGRLGLPPALQTRIAERHRIRFDSSAAQRLRPGTDAVLAVQGSALATLRRARALGIAAILDATLPHPRLMQRLVEEDRRGAEALPPGFAERRVAELEAADRVLVPSSFARDSYVEAGVEPASVVVVPLGVDRALFPPRPLREDDGSFRVLFVGRLSRLKGVPELVDAVALAGIPEVELVLVGDRSTAERSWFADPHVRHVAAVPRQLMASLYAAADVHVLPTLGDSFGHVILEAMACGVPVIASASSGGPDLIEEGRTGYVVPARDARALAERLARLAADPELREQMGAAAARAAERWTWAAYGERLAAAVGE